MSKDQGAKAAFDRGLKGESVGGQVSTEQALVHLFTLGFGPMIDPPPTSEEKSAHAAGKAIHDKR